MIYRRILMAGHGFDVETTAPLYFQTPDEMLAEFDYLGATLAHELVVEAPQQLQTR